MSIDDVVFAMFLFQTGSIRSGAALRRGVWVSPRFLFQTGSIRSVSDSCYSDLLQSFYSKLVRLEENWDTFWGIWHAVSIPNWFD